MSGRNGCPSAPRVCCRCSSEFRFFLSYLVLSVIKNVYECESLLEYVYIHPEIKVSFNICQILSVLIRSVSLIFLRDALLNYASSLVFLPPRCFPLPHSSNLGLAERKRKSLTLRTGTTFNEVDC